MSSTAPTYRFGEFELDLPAFELRRSGKAVKLEKRSFDLLALLVQKAGSVVPREELIARLWSPNVVIDFDSGLNTLVRKARAALDDSPESPRYIETVPGRGYRFVAALELAAPAPVAGLSPAAAALESPAPQPVLAETGGERTVTTGPKARSRPSARTALLWTLVLVGVLGTLATFVPQRTMKPTRIAVLPFENLTGDEQLAYLAAGLAEDTSISLAQVDVTHLRVVGVLDTGGTNVTRPLDELGRRLGVDLVVKSALRLDRSRIRVTSRLLRVTNGEQVWSASFDRELTNVLGLQRELSTAIAEQVRLRLSPQWQAAIARRQTENPQAYALYLKGRYEWAQLTPASIRRALAYFRQAAELDPDYPLAWAAIAFGSITSLRTMDADPEAVRPVALEALRRAERLGPDLVETRYARGYYHLFLELDAASAAQEARDMLRRSRELDPGFALAYANSANVAIGSDDVAGALELARQSIAISPDFWVGHLYLGQALDRSGDLEGALLALNEAARLSEGHSLTFTSRTDVLLKLGRREEARALVAEFEARAARQHVPAYYGAVMHAQLGNVDDAFDWLERALSQRSIGLTGMPKDKRLAPLRDDPRFAELVARCACDAAPGFNP